MYCYNEQCKNKDGNVTIWSGLYVDQVARFGGDVAFADGSTLGRYLQVVRCIFRPAQVD
jgi:hypothetical protein